MFQLLINGRPEGLAYRSPNAARRQGMLYLRLHNAARFEVVPA